jgi:hypothetical protein
VNGQSGKNDNHGADHGAGGLDQNRRMTERLCKR